MPWTAPWRGCAAKPSNFGAFVDSVTDRYSELVIFGGCCSITCSTATGYCTPRWLTWQPPDRSWFLIHGRAPNRLDCDTKVGILTRMERYIVLAPLLVITELRP